MMTTKLTAEEARNIRDAATPESAAELFLAQVYDRVRFAAAMGKDETLLFPHGVKRLPVAVGRIVVGRLEADGFDVVYGWSHGEAATLVSWYASKDGEKNAQA